MSNSELARLCSDVMARDDQALAEVEEQMALGPNRMATTAIPGTDVDCTTNLDPPERGSA